MIVTSARAKMSPKELVDIKDLKLGMKNITLQVIILDIGKIVDIVFECFVCSLFLFFFFAFRLAKLNQGWQRSAISQGGRQVGLDQYVRLQRAGKLSSARRYLSNHTMVTMFCFGFVVLRLTFVYI